MRLKNFVAKMRRKRRERRVQKSERVQEYRQEAQAEKSSDIVLTLSSPLSRTESSIVDTQNAVTALRGILPKGQERDLETGEDERLKDEWNELNDDENKIALECEALLSESVRHCILQEDAWYAMRRVIRSYKTSPPKKRIKEAVASLEALAEFRLLHKFAELSQNDLQVRGLCFQLLNSWRAIHFNGYDVYGHPIIYEDAGMTVNIFADIHNVALETLLAGRAYATQLLQALKVHATNTLPLRGAESASEKIKRAQPPPPILKHVYIVDLKALRLGDLTAQVRRRFRFVLTTLETVYPEVVFRTYLINAPNSLTFLWLIVSSWLHSSTRAKIRVLPAGRDPERIRADLIADGIPGDSIPLCFGGTVQGVPLADVFDVSDKNTSSFRQRDTSPRNSIDSPLQTLLHFRQKNFRDRAPSIIFSEAEDDEELGSVFSPRWADRLKARSQPFSSTTKQDLSPPPSSFVTRYRKFIILFLTISLLLIVAVFFRLPLFASSVTTRNSYLVAPPPYATGEPSRRRSSRFLLSASSSPMLRATTSFGSTSPPHYP